MGYLTLAARCLIGVVFAVSALSKLRTRAAYRAFAVWLADLPIVTARGRAAAAPILVSTEVTIVTLVALPWLPQAGLLLAVAVLAAFAMGTVAVIRRGAREPCQCFGASAAPLGIRHVLRDIVLCVVAGAGAAGAAGHLPARPAGIALSLLAGAVCAALVVFLDDIAAILTSPQDRSYR